MPELFGLSPSTASSAYWGNRRRHAGRPRVAAQATNRDGLPNSVFPDPALNAGSDRESSDPPLTAHYCLIMCTGKRYGTYALSPADPVIKQGWLIGPVSRHGATEMAYLLAPGTHRFSQSLWWVAPTPQVP